MLHAMNSLLGAPIYTSAWDAIYVHSKSMKSSVAQAFSRYVRAQGVPTNTFNTSVFPYQTLTQGTKILTLELESFVMPAQLLKMRSPHYFNLVCSSFGAKSLILRIDSLQFFSEDLQQAHE